MKNSVFWRKVPEYQNELEFSAGISTPATRYKTISAVKQGPCTGWRAHFQGC